MNFTSCDRLPDRLGAVVEELAALTEAGSCCWSGGSSVLDRVAPPPRCWCPGWRCTASTMARALPSEPARDLSFSTPSMTRGHVVEPHRRAVAVGDDRAAGNCGRALELAGGLRVKALALAAQRAGGQVGVAPADDGGAHLVDADAARRQRLRVELDRARRTSASRRPCTCGDARDRARSAAPAGLARTRSASTAAGWARSARGRGSGWSAGFTFRKEGGLGMFGGQLAARRARSPTARPARRRRCCGRGRTAA